MAERGQKSRLLDKIRSQARELTAVNIEVDKWRQYAKLCEKRVVLLSPGHGLPVREEDVLGLRHAPRADAEPSSHDLRKSATLRREQAQCFRAMAQLEQEHRGALEKLSSAVKQLRSLHGSFLSKEKEAREATTRAQELQAEVGGLRRRLAVYANAGSGRSGPVRSASVQRAREAEVRDWRMKAQSAEEALEQARNRIQVLEESLQVKAEESGAPKELIEELAAVKLESLELRKKFQSLESKSKALEQENERLESDLSDKEHTLEEVDTARKTAAEELEERNRTGDGRFVERLKVERNALTGHLQEYVAVVEKVKRERDKRIAALQSKAQAQSEELTGKVNELQSSLRRAEEECSRKADDLRALQAKVEASESELSEMATLQVELMRQCQAAHQDATDNRDMHSSSRGEIMTLSETLKQIQHDLDQEARVNRDLKTDKEALLSQVQAYEAEVATLRQRSEELHEARIAASQAKDLVERESPTLNAVSRLRRLLEDGGTSESTESLLNFSAAPPLLGRDNLAKLENVVPSTLEDAVLKKLSFLEILPAQVQSLRHFRVHPGANMVSYQLEPESGYVLLSNSWLRALQSEDLQTVSPALKACMESLVAEVILLTVSLLRASEIASAFRQKHETMMSALEKHSQDVSQERDSLQEAKTVAEQQIGTLRERVAVLEPHFAATKELHTLLLATDFHPRASIEITVQPEALPSSLAALIQHYFALVTKASSLEGQLADVVVKNGSLLKESTQLKQKLRERDAELAYLRKETDASTQTHQLEKEGLTVELAGAARLAEQQNSLTSTLEERLATLQVQEKSKELEISSMKTALIEHGTKLRELLMELYVVFRVHASTRFSSRAHVDEFLKEYPAAPQVHVGPEKPIGEAILDSAPMLFKAVEVLQFMYTDASATATAAQRALDSLQSKPPRLIESAGDGVALGAEDAVENLVVEDAKSEVLTKTAAYDKTALSKALAQQRHHFEELQKKYGLKRAEVELKAARESAALENLRRAKESLIQADGFHPVGPTRSYGVGKSPLQIRLERAREAFALARGSKGR